MTTRLAILISGRGSNMLAIVEAAQKQNWDVDLLVVSNRPQAPGLKLAQDRGVDTLIVDHRAFRGRREEFDSTLASALQDAGVDWVALAGFMRILGPRFTGPFAGRVDNIHPSLLPAHPGLDTHQRALDAGDSHAGCTVHLVDDTLDGGPILAQVRVPVLNTDDADSLAARVLLEEHRLFPQVISRLLDGALDPRRPTAFQLQPTGGAPPRGPEAST